MEDRSPLTSTPTPASGVELAGEQPRPLAELQSQAVRGGRGRMQWEDTLERAPPHRGRRGPGVWVCLADADASEADPAPGPVLNT